MKAPLATLTLLVLLLACGVPPPPTTGPTERPAPRTPVATSVGSLAEGNAKLQRALVVKVVDGDTIDVLMGNERFRVRYIGVDAPEPSQPYGTEAWQSNRALVEGQQVYLEKDVSETDRYGRLLRYVWLRDGTMVNARLVASGYARVVTYPPDVAHADEFLRLEQQARERGLGLWGGAPVQALACDAAYPDVCIPPPPPDLDCKDIAYRNVRVLPPDPHRLDGDGNGVGCET